MEHKEIDYAEILKNAIEAVNSNYNQMARLCGYASPSSLYHIKEGRNNITIDMANKMIDAFPQLNYLYLTKGEGPITINPNEAIGQHNVFAKGGASFDDVPAMLNDIRAALNRIYDKMCEND